MNENNADFSQTDGRRSVDSVDEPSSKGRPCTGSIDPLQNLEIPNNESAKKSSVILKSSPKKHVPVQQLLDSSTFVQTPILAPYQEELTVPIQGHCLSRAEKQKYKKTKQFRFATSFILPWFNLWYKQYWYNTGSLDRVQKHAEDAGTGVIIAANHINNIDPLIVGNVSYSHGVMPHFLAKDSLFKIPLLGSLMKYADQIPVERGTKNAGFSLEVAKDVLGRSEGILIFPEGTLTRHPEKWPMAGHSGAMKLALETGAPIVPVAHFPVEELNSKRSKFFRPQVNVLVGNPLNLSQYEGQEITPRLLQEATGQLMQEILNLETQLRPTADPPEKVERFKFTPRSVKRAQKKEARRHKRSRN